MEEKSLSDHPEAFKADKPVLQSALRPSAYKYWQVWGVLALLLCLALPPLLIDLGQRDAMREMESRALLSAQETWQRMHGDVGIAREPGAWLMPTQRGHPRLNKPPMIVWLDLVAWSNLKPGHASVEQLIYRARLVTVSLGLVMLASIFWAGFTLGDLKTAALALGAAATMWYVQRQMRMASYDLQMASWASLSIAGGLWAMAPFAPRPGRWRTLLGWTVAGVAMSLSWLTKGPIVLVAAALPMVAIVAMTPQRRTRNGLNLVMTVSLVLLLVAPWYVYMYQHAAGAITEWGAEYRANRNQFQVPWYYLGLLGLVLPWTLWLIAGLFQPFFDAKEDRRRQMLIPWVWFMVIFIAYSIPGAKQQRYILPIIPAAAILIAQVFREHHRQAKLGFQDPGVKWLAIPQWAVMTGLSLLMAPFLLTQHWMLVHGYYDQLPIGQTGAALAVGLSFVLTFIALAGAYVHHRWRPLTAAGCIAIWALILTTALWHVYAFQPKSRQPLKAPARALAVRIGSHPIYRLRTPDHYAVDVQFLLYARRIIPEKSLADLPRLTSHLDKQTYLITSLNKKRMRRVAALKWKRVDRFAIDNDRQVALWVHGKSLPTAKHKAD